jgi:CPA2 family monovalent cation:H+ antiporter-2
MPHSVELITTIATALGLALIFGFMAVRLRLPALVGYLLAGIMIGPFTPGFAVATAMGTAVAMAWGWRRWRGSCSGYRCRSRARWYC